MKKQRVVASVEARMASSRLPGKMMADIHGMPTLARVFQRLRRSERLGDIVLATTTSPEDDILVDCAESMKIPVWRGSETDVLNRVVGAHRMMETDLIVEICGDCPLIDPEIIDLAVETFEANTADVVSNTSKLSFPQGIDAQVFPLKKLEEVEQSILDPAVREHVSLYFYENPTSYQIIHLVAPPRWRHPEIRLQLDYPEDLQLIRQIFERLEPDFGDEFGIEQVCNQIRHAPELAEINANCIERPVRT